jgi:hypothetical protein
MNDTPKTTEMLGFRDVDIATSLFEACEEGEEIAVRAIMSRLRFERNKERARCLNILDEEGWLGCSRERIASGTGSDGDRPCKVTN